ncbi:MAG: hypothetical protein NC453_16715 [Muribaculum sp.]|nr:hypothetical protein [Muribaculum sp.]
MVKTIQDQINEPNGLRRYIIPHGIYLDGAITMLLRLRDHLLLEENHQGKVTAEDRIYNKAIIDLLLSSKDNAERFIYQDYDEIRFKDHERDKKGKLIRCRAYFAQRVTSYKELE